MRRTRTATGVGVMLTVVIALLTFVPMATATATPAAGSTGSDAACRHSGERATHGQAAVDKLGAGIAEAAAHTHRSAETLRSQLLSDPTLWVDSCAMTFYVDPALPAGAATPLPPAAAPFPYSQTFLLHSKPGSQRTIYLDFDGEQIASNGAWSVQYGTPPGTGWFAPPFDTNGNPNSFGTGEQDAIQEVWQRVSEDYAPFDVDVTTQNPGTAAIDRSDPSDQVYGTRALITEDTVIGTPCGCGGIAYINVFNDSFSHMYYQPALIFPQNLGLQDPQLIAEAVAHEVGHNFGLSHDGTNADGPGSYYLGQGSWAPIMGASYYHSITQWSRGEYADANNTEDDLSIIATGAPVRADDHGDTRPTATVLPSSAHVTAAGRITTRTDKDMFRFQAAGPTTIQVNPAPVGPDLDIRADLFDATGTPVTFSDPPAHDVTQGTSAGMNAAITQTLPSGTYYLQVDGVGQGNVLTTGYTDYASLGPYTVDIVTKAITITPATLGDATRGTAYTTAMTASGATAPYTWTVTAGSLPAGLSLSPTGVITGTPTGTGTSNFTLTVTDSSAVVVTNTWNGSILVLAGPSALLHPVLPTRLFDTRDGTGGVPVAKIVGGQSLQFHVAGKAGLPSSGLGTVALNVTVTNPAGPGFVTVYPCGAVPTASNVNYSANQTVPNAVIAPVSVSGDVCFYTTSTTNLLADVSAWTALGSDLHPVTPTRLFDTRDGTGGVPVAKIAAGTSLTFQVTGKASVPLTGVGTVIMNVTVTEPTQGGFITVYPCGALPMTSNVNYSANQTVPNLVIAPVSASGTVCFYARGTTHLLADISAWVATPSDLHPVTPARLFDTRDGTGGVPLAKIQPGHVLTFQVAGHGGTPTAGVGAVALNVTVTDPTGPGFVTVYPCGTLPTTSNVNFSANQTVPNAVLAPVSQTGMVCFYVSAGASTNLLADISAWFPA